jgi:hypothetical protein
VLYSTDLAYFGASDEDVGASLHSGAQGFESTGIMDEDDRQIVYCLEDVKLLLMLSLKIHCGYVSF